jgi:hypothetical protein
MIDHYCPAGGYTCTGRQACWSHRHLLAGPRARPHLHRRPWAGQTYYAKEDIANPIATRTRRITELDPHDSLAYTSLSRADQREGMIPEVEEAAYRARTLGGKKQLEGWSKDPNASPSARAVR